MFVWRWNKEDEKFWRENDKENFLECVWLDENEGKYIVRSMCFLLSPIKKFSLQNQEKTEERIGHHFWTKILMCNSHSPVHVALLHFYFPFFFFFPLDVAYLFIYLFYLGAGKPTRLVLIYIFFFYFLLYFF